MALHFKNKNQREGVQAATDADRRLFVLLVCQRPSSQWPSGNILCASADVRRGRALPYGLMVLEEKLRDDLPPLSR
jgi:hypothetical protein